MTEDEMRAVLQPHTAEIGRTTAALYRYIPGRESHFGSGVLLRVGGTPFMLTAAHVADEFQDLKWKDIFFGTPSFEPIYIGNITWNSSPKRKDPFRSDDPFDVAAVELSQEVADKLSTFMRFVTLDDLLLDPEKLGHGVFLINGFPASRVETDETEETISAVNLPYITHLHDRDQPPIPDFDPPNNMAFNASRPHEDGGHSFGVDLDYTAGMSGGGIWRLFDEGKPVQTIDWKKAKLVGILTEGTDPNYAGSTGYFRGTKLRYVIRLLVGGWPHLEPDPR